MIPRYRRTVALSSSSAVVARSPAWPLALVALVALAGCTANVVGGGSGGEEPRTCEYEGTTHEFGERWNTADGCNSCECTDAGWACTLMRCTPACSYDGLVYRVGETFPDVDGCNTCECQADGSVACSEKGCGPEGCLYEDVHYDDGASFPASDGCNTCTCSGGQAMCTLTPCEACDPAAEWWRNYVADSPGKCAAIDYDCAEGLTMFQNECGCGCEQDASCPEYFDCMPPTTCDEQALSAKCPLSKFAY